MMPKTIALLALVAAASCSPLKVAESTKAASPYVNLGCQCSALTFVDQYGTVQGNCRAADSTGARWCYVDNTYPGSSCQDLRFSARFPQKAGWSYEACATPLPVVVPAPGTLTVPSYGSSYGSAGSLYGSNLGTLQPYGEFIPKSGNSVDSSDAVKFN